MQLIGKRKKQPQVEQQDQKKKYSSENQALIEATRVNLKKTDHLLACLNKKHPPNIERKTGDQAAKKGFIIPLTPRELKLKLKM